MAKSLTERLGFFTAGLQDRSLDTVLEHSQRWGVTALELAVGGYPGSNHADAIKLLQDHSARQHLQRRLADARLDHLVLSCHCNPLHPDPDKAAHADQLLQATLQLANQLDVDRIVTFSGVGGTNKQLSWPVVHWPNEYPDNWERTWQDQLIPYWQPIARRAKELGVSIALELHGGFLVHSPGTLHMLRTACGSAIGANLDPSHFWWQGLDPLAGIDLLHDALLHVHVKDWLADPEQVALWGMLDPRRMGSSSRAWEFAMPGRGHDAAFWQAFSDRLQAVAYQGMLSVEHEDATVSAIEGIPQTLAFMRTLHDPARHGTAE